MQDPYIIFRYKENKKMRQLIKKHFIFLWVFFFCLSLTGDSPYNIGELVLISSIYSLSILYLVNIFLLFTKPSNLN